VLVSVHVCPPSCDVAVAAELFDAKSPPPTIPSIALRNATEMLPALGELTSGVSYAFHVLPPSRVASILAIDDPPVAIHAFSLPCVVMHVPLAENDASPPAPAAYSRKSTARSAHRLCEYPETLHSPSRCA